MSLGSATTASLLSASSSAHAYPVDHPVNRDAIGADNQISSISSSTSTYSPLMSRVSSEDCRRAWRERIGGEHGGVETCVHVHEGDEFPDQDRALEACSKACRENRRRGDGQDREFWAKVEGCSKDVEDLSQRVRFGEVAQDRHDDDWTQTTSNNNDNTQPSQRPRRGRSPTPRPSPRPHQPTTTTNDDDHARLDVNMKCVLMSDPPLKLSGGVR